ncbi:hypothetical protein GPECTOR_6g878 [Gonium pectorale]|uniref:Heterokaryon incompatibility domain-containing protein n=1 Tax=Gonium pectorale TaxID=33097 RepID=A0A150GVU4_GONPE|nr:hypothetical protein GPECTOR_6g878 [Gonium pectorale]|eukprot:KXZ53959.1 hypothetical protein GPECTOR_6g878 [Gonium pectorale]
MATQSRTLEATAVAERKRLDEAATAERKRQDEAAAAVRKQLDDAAEAERRRQDEEAAAARKQLDEDAAALRKRLDDDAAAQRQQLDEGAAQERRLLDEAAAAERRRLDDESAAERKRLTEAMDIAGALFGPMKPGGTNGAEPPRVSMSRESNLSALDDEAAAARRRRLGEEAEAQRRILDEAAAVARRRLDEAAAAERRRLDEEAAAERRRLGETAAAVLGSLQLSVAASTPPPPPAAAEVPVARSPEPEQQEAAPAPETTASADPVAEPPAAAAAAPEPSTPAPVSESPAPTPLPPNLVYEDNTPEELRAHMPTTGVPLAELPESILDLHDGMPAALRTAPMRLLQTEAVLAWPNIKVYEEVGVADCVELPYISVTDEMWNCTIILSWRWNASKPAEYQPGFSPMSDMQFAELTAVLRRAAALGIAYAWIDWCCVPQYKSDSMVEVLRSKVYYARARAMTVVPTFYPIPAEGIVRLLLVKANRVIKKRADTSAVAAIVAGRLESILSKEQVAGREYFSRIWTLAERMARFGRPERLSNWLSLEAWLGTLVDALLKSTDDRKASAIYKRILGPEAGAILDSVLDPLQEAVKTGSMHVALNLEEKLVELFELAVGIWKSSSELSEEPTPQWLLGIYAAWNDADRIWAVYSYFCWKQLDKASSGAVLEALQDLVRVAGGGRKHLMGMATKLGLAKMVEVDPTDQQLLAAAKADDLNGVMEALAAGAYPDAPEVDGTTAMHHAAAANNAEAVRALIEAGASLEVRTSVADTPLLVAAAGNCVDAAKALLTAGAKVNSVGKGHEDMVRTLLQAGAMKEALTQASDTPMAVAVTAGKDGVLRLLVDAGANQAFKYTNGFTLLHQAARLGHEGVAKMLLSLGAVKDALNKEGASPLHLAARNNRPAVIMCLLEAGANIEQLVPKIKHTPLHEAALGNAADAVQALIQLKANKEVKTADGWRALHLAAHFGRHGCIKALLEAGAMGKAKAKNGNVPYECADAKSTKALLPKPDPVTFFGLF